MTEPQNHGSSIRIVTKVLTRAVQIWLRSQVSAIDNLEIQIDTSDRQLLSGSIPAVSVIASQAIYRGIHITHIKLNATNITTNLSAVLRGKAIKLLEPVPVYADATFSEEAFRASLASEILSPALQEILVKFLPENYPKTKRIIYQSIELGMQQLKIFTIFDPEESAIPLEFHLGLELVSQNILQIQEIQVIQAGQIVVENPSGITLNLGSDVEFNQLTIQPGKICCQGTLKINP
ncbi:LmeA family phospholipid-binding protein [Calothrix sp. NIES-3974]|uniref:LmeA family phospholipid-binding protein n=1 Tax=Calothrix sp. NIES-3974 TaxID=2005462 RepID=UPI000B6047B1|nr:DUF2993 domain-containing protein [Calothrix sp. NIES-3974]BAZ06727.1 hypothetical protein NIES3974_33890 [Calothrix sp. NIES-3974]